MKTRIFRLLITFFAISFLMVSCSKNNDDHGKPNQTTRKVKYEFSGNYSGKLLVVTSTNSGNLQQFDQVGTVWSKEIEYEKSVLAAGMSFQTSGTNTGISGQTISVKVYLNGTLKDIKTFTADANGLINSALAFYTF